MRKCTIGCLLIGVLFSQLLLFCSPTVPVDTPDKLERVSVWQYLKIYSIYDTLLKNDPFEYNGIQEMFDMLGDTLKGGSYTSYINESGTKIEPYATAVNTAATKLVVFDSLTDSCCLIKIATFMDTDDESVYEQFKSILSQVKKFSKIIVDVRNNLGGNLITTDSVIEDMLPAGIPYIYAHERVYNSSARTVRTADSLWMTKRDARQEFVDKQFAVLINGMTASAGEILALALKDGVNAPMFGSTSYGKGIGQIHIVRRDRPWLQITYLHLYRYQDSSDYHRVGIVPDTPSAQLQLLGVSESDKPLFYAIKTLQPSVVKGAISYPKPVANLAKPSDPGGMYKVIYESDSTTED